MLTILGKPDSQSQFCDGISRRNFLKIGSLHERLKHTIAEQVQKRNFFHGTNPFLIERVFRTDAILAPRLSNLRLYDPWLWNLGPRTYAVCAVAFTRL